MLIRWILDDQGIFTTKGDFAFNPDHPPPRTPPYVVITLRVMDRRHAERDDYFECSIRITHQHERSPVVGVVIRPQGL